MFARERVNVLAISNLPVSPGSDFGYFGVLSALIPYDNEIASNQIVSNNSITYALGGNLFALGGLQLHYAKGLVPYVGGQLFRASPKWLLLLSPNVQLAPTANLEGVMVLEFKPELRRGLRLYTRLQSIYNYQIEDGATERGLAYTRAGVSYKRTTVGLGLNYDYYGRGDREETYAGVFVNHLF